MRPLNTRASRELRQVGNLRHGPGSRLAFSLIEIMVAVSLLAVIIVGLLAMFYQTERAFRGGVTQVDILESGRATMELLATELQELSPCRHDEVINIYASNSFPLFVQTRLGSAWDHTNQLQDYFFLSRRNDEWIGIGYVVDLEPVTTQPNAQASIGTLYRFETNVPLGLIFRPYEAFREALLPANPPQFTNYFHRVADRVIHLKLTPYKENGVAYTNSPVPNPFPNVDYKDGDFSFQNTVVPAYLDLELGVLEPRTFERYRVLTDIDVTRGAQFLKEQVQRVQLFRQRIPIRTAQ